MEGIRLLSALQIKSPQTNNYHTTTPLDTETKIKWTTENSTPGFTLESLQEFHCTDARLQPMIFRFSELV